MNESMTLATIRAICPLRTVPPPLEILIEVPEAKGCRQTRSHRRAASFGPRYTRTKRRLRREVRLAGYSLLALMPIVSACTTGWSSRPGRVVACSIIADTTNDNLPAFAPSGSASEQGGDALRSTNTVVLSAEGNGVVPGSDAEVPVVFPGYLLPVDSQEDAAHEGS
jgi:hypothetical protein